MAKIESHIFHKKHLFNTLLLWYNFEEGGIHMIDTIFTAIEDIYFQVIDDSTPEGSDPASRINLSDATLSPLIEEFRERARNTPYKGATGNQFKLLKVAGFILNYIMYGDDGKISSDERDLINKFIKSRFSKLSDDERNELTIVFDNRATLWTIEEYIQSHSLPLRSLDMILETLIDQVQDENRYFLPFESIYIMLLEKF